MGLHLYNTKTRSVEAFKPLQSNKVSLYACGPTVYDKTHIGHMRKYVGDDILRRTLALIGYEVTHVMNITDVGHLTNDSDHGDDKLEGKAAQENKTVWDVAREYQEYFDNTMRALNVLSPTVEPKATDHIAEMRALVETLLAKGFAYETAQAIYFDTTKDPDYGKLSRQKITEKSIGAREDVVTDPEKHHPSDFALWFKRVGKFADHTMHWPNPNGIAGEGFPGWHIECSAMSMHYLGETIDIHTGGIDHIPVHHENEIAQSECATGHEFVRFWVHYDFLNVDGEKMSKSKGNFYTIDDIRARGFDPLALRLLFMQTHYRKASNFTWDSVAVADAQLKKLQKFVRGQELVGSVDKKYVQEFTDALCDDMNTAKALATLWELFGDTTLDAPSRYATILTLDTVLGLELKAIPKLVVTPEAKTLVEKRDKARDEKDYIRSDELRKELENLGYEVSDTSDGTVLS